MSQIDQINGLEILDSRGVPTIEVTVRLTSGVAGRASVPSGASTGSREAHELRDGDPHRFGGKGVLQALNNIEQVIAPLLKGHSVFEQQTLDRLMIEKDGCADKHRLGANAILGVSLAMAHAAAQERSQSLYQYLAPTDKRDFHMPVPLINIINGGVHANNRLSIQEFMIIPLHFSDFATAMRCGADIFSALRTLFSDAGLSIAVGDEGGFAPDLSSDRVALDYMMRAIEKAGYRPGEHVFLGLDVASSECYRDGVYHLGDQALTVDGMIDYFSDLVSRYPLISIEDGMAEDDFDGWCALTRALGHRLQLVGDDLFVTQQRWLEAGIAKGMANAILIKPNQVGTLSETLATIERGQVANYATIISHRSGETTDDTIADLAVATSAMQIKTGSVCRGERLSKYNRLLSIAHTLGERAQYAGFEAFKKVEKV